MSVAREWPTKADQTRMEVIAKSNRIAQLAKQWARERRLEPAEAQRLIEIQALALESVILLVQAKPGTGPLKLEE